MSFWKATINFQVVTLIRFARARRLTDKWALGSRHFTFYEIQSAVPFRLFLKFRLRVAKSYSKWPNSSNIDEASRGRIGAF